MKATPWAEAAANRAREQGAKTSQDLFAQLSAASADAHDAASVADRERERDDCEARLLDLVEVPDTRGAAYEAWATALRSALSSDSVSATTAATSLLLWFTRAYPLRGLHDAKSYAARLRVFASLQECAESALATRSVAALVREALALQPCADLIRGLLVPRGSVLELQQGATHAQAVAALHEQPFALPLALGANSLDRRVADTATRTDTYACVSGALVELVAAGSAPRDCGRKVLWLLSFLVSNVESRPPSAPLARCLLSDLSQL
eukprot:m51a1_g3497 hypothetical protein (266) ;mRNA; r:816011-816808